MNAQSTEGGDPDTQTQLTLLAASHHDVEALRSLLRTTSASVQDPETGFTPLHAAIAACEEPNEIGDPLPNGHALVNPHAGPENGTPGSDHENTAQFAMEAAVKTVKLLLQNGAIWNDVDTKNETPGCLALRLGLIELYNIMVDAGVRAEMLLSRLDEYEQLANDEEKVEDEQDIVLDTKDAVPSDHTPSTDDRPTELQAQPENPLSSLEVEPKNDDYLESTLRFQEGRILDSASNGVMMAWETDLMQRTAELLAPAPGLRILNIGHGMGIIDTLFQAKAPSTHHIIEAHPAVLARMRQDGWYNKPDVTVHEGRWQDVVPRLLESEGGTLFDAIYFDTFAEDYKALRDFFSDSVIGLLDDGGKWGFFNGLGADRQICYDVYGKVVEMDLFEAGFDTVWEALQIPEMGPQEWEGVKRKYWALKQYKLPTCTFIG